MREVVDFRLSDALCIHGGACQALDAAEVSRPAVVLALKGHRLADSLNDEDGPGHVPADGSLVRHVYLLDVRDAAQLISRLRRAFDEVGAGPDLAGATEELLMMAADGARLAAIATDQPDTGGYL